MGVGYDTASSKTKIVALMNGGVCDENNKVYFRKLG